MKGVPPEVWVYLGCVMFFLGMYKEAEEACTKGTLFVWKLCLNITVNTEWTKINVLLGFAEFCFSLAHLVDNAELGETLFLRASQR